MQKLGSMARSYAYHSYEQDNRYDIFWRGINNHSFFYHFANWSLTIIIMATIIPNDLKSGGLTQPSNIRLAQISSKALDTTNTHAVLLLSRPWNADASTAHTLAQALNLHHLPPPRSLISPPLQGFNNTKYLLPLAHHLNRLAVSSTKSIQKHPPESRITPSLGLSLPRFVLQSGEPDSTRVMRDS